jgi:hypothetical protein
LPVRAELRPAAAFFSGWPHAAGSSVKVELINDGQAAAEIPAAKTIPSDSFRIIHNACTGELAAGAHCSIAVQFHAQRTGIAVGSLMVTDSAKNSPQRTLLVGVGF